jgi:hypothetical protein
MKNKVLLSVTALLIALNFGCSATTYGKNPEADAIESDVYTFTLYKNIFASIFGKNYMKEKSNKEISAFMTENGYARYEILSSERRDAMANKNMYKVKFYKE